MNCDELGKILKTVDKMADVVYNYEYDEKSNITAENRNDQRFKTLEYDKFNRLTKTTVATSDETLVYIPTYESTHPDRVLTGMSLDGVFEERLTRDEQRRLREKTLRTSGSELLATSYTYHRSGDRLTGLVESASRRVNGFDKDTLKYAYDENGNITRICNTDGVCETPLCEYKYDGLNRLVRENNFVLGKTFTYTYDAAGNILCKRTYNVTSGAVVTPIETKDYAYETTGWKDKLTAYDGTAITYDALGNPTSYRGHNLTWDRIRLLKQWDNISFDYNATGMRTRKGDTTYEIDGKNILSETTNGNRIRYYYGMDGITGFRYNGAYYYYEKNLQGDITGIYTASGTLVGEYSYDAWGNCTVEYDYNGIASVNPFRYRSYYFDRETGLYYLKARYYDPQTGRWISPEPNVYMGKFDSEAGLNGYNTYAYCANNYVNYFDPTGEFVISTLLVCVIAGAIIGATVGGFVGNAYANSQGYTGWDKTKSILMGIGIGGVGGGALGYFAAPAVVSATGVAGISITSAGVSTLAAMGTSFGSLGTLIANNGQQIIDWNRTTMHGMQRMAERGVTQNMVETWARTGMALQQTGDKILYVTKQGAAVITKVGQVITAYTNEYFDDTMNEVVGMLFGK